MQQNVKRKGEVRKRRDRFISRDVYGDISWTKEIRMQVR